MFEVERLRIVGAQSDASGLQVGVGDWCGVRCRGSGSRNEVRELEF